MIGLALAGLASVVAATHPRGVRRFLGLGTTTESHRLNAIDFADSAIEYFEEGSCVNALGLASAAQNEASHVRDGLKTDPIYEEMIELNDWIRSQCRCKTESDSVPDRFKRMVDAAHRLTRHGLSSVENYDALNETIEDAEDLLSIQYTADAKIDAPFGVLGFRKRALMSRVPGEDWSPLKSRSAIMRAQALQLLPSLESELQDSHARRSEEIARGLLVGRQWIQSKRHK